VPQREKRCVDRSRCCLKTTTLTVVDRPAVGVYPAGARLPMRVIDDWELVWVRRGAATLTGDPRLLLGVGDVVLIPPGHRHGFDWSPDRETEHGYVHLDLAEVGAGPAATGGHLPLHAVTTDDDPLRGLCAYLLWLGRTEPAGWQRVLTVTMQQVLLHLTAMPRPTAEADTLRTPLDLAVAHLRRAWSSPPLTRVSVSELATSAHVSPVHLGRLFRSTFGLGLAESQERLRCLHAIGLLERTDLGVAVVARRCGFSDVSHFSHRFTLVTGRSPSAARAAPGSVDLRRHPGVRRLEHLVLPH
jgi:AraC-like DNA-binding protein